VDRCLSMQGSLGHSPRGLGCGLGGRATTRNRLTAPRTYLSLKAAGLLDIRPILEHREMSSFGSLSIRSSPLSTSSLNTCTAIPCSIPEACLMRIPTSGGVAVRNKSARPTGACSYWAERLGQLRADAAAAGSAVLDGTVSGARVGGLVIADEGLDSGLNAPARYCDSQPRRRSSRCLGTKLGLGLCLRQIACDKLLKVV